MNDLIKIRIDVFELTLTLSFLSLFFHRMFFLLFFVMINFIESVSSYYLKLKQYLLVLSLLKTNKKMKTFLLSHEQVIPSSPTKRKSLRLQAVQMKPNPLYPSDDDKHVWIYQSYQSQQQGSTSLHLYGKSKNNRSVYIKAQIPQISIYVQMPQSVKTVDQQKDIIKQFKKKCSSIQIVTKEPFYKKKTNEHGSKFLKLSVKTKTNLKKLKKLFNDNQKICGHRFDKIKEFQVPTNLKILIDYSIPGIGWIEIIDGSYRQWPNKLIQINCKVSNIKPSKNEDIPPLKILTFKMCALKDRKGIPYEILNIACKSKRTQVNSMDDQTQQFQNCQNEKELLGSFQKFVIEYDPDIIVGYNCRKELKSMIEISQKLEIQQEFLKLGKNKQLQLQWDQRTKKKDWVHIPGRILIDIGMYISHHYSLLKQNAYYAFHYFLPDEHLQIFSNKIKTKLYNENKLILAQHSIKKVNLAYQLLSKLTIVNNLISTSQESGVPMQILEKTESQQNMIRSIFLRSLIKIGCILNQNQIQQNWLSKKQKQRQSIDLSLSFVCLKKQYNEQPIIHLKTKNLVQRIIVQQHKSYQNPQEDQSNLIKILYNSSDFKRRLLSKSVVTENSIISYSQLYRNMTELKIKKLRMIREKMQNEFKAKVVLLTEKDLMIQYKQKIDIRQAIKKGADLASILSKQTNLNIDFVNVYDPLIIMSTQIYAGVSYNQQNSKGIIQKIGISNIINNQQYIDLTLPTIQNFIDEYLKNHQIQKVKKSISQLVKRLCQGQVQINQLVISTVLGKKAISYQEIKSNRNSDNPNSQNYQRQQKWVQQINDWVNRINKSSMSRKSVESLFPKGYQLFSVAIINKQNQKDIQKLYQLTQKYLNNYLKPKQRQDLSELLGNKKLTKYRFLKEIQENNFTINACWYVFKCIEPALKIIFNDTNIIGNKQFHSLFDLKIFFRKLWPQQQIFGYFLKNQQQKIQKKCQNCQRYNKNCANCNQMKIIQECFENEQKEIQCNRQIRNIIRKTKKIHANGWRLCSNYRCIVSEVRRKKRKRRAYKQKAEDSLKRLKQKDSDYKSNKSDIDDQI